MDVGYVYASSFIVYLATTEMLLLHAVAVGMLLQLWGPMCLPMEACGEVRSLMTSS